MRILTLVEKLSDKYPESTLVGPCLIDSRVKTQEPTIERRWLLKYVWLECPSTQQIESLLRKTLKTVSNARSWSILFLTESRLPGEGLWCSNLVDLQHTVQSWWTQSSKSKKAMNRATIKGFLDPRFRQCLDHGLLTFAGRHHMVESIRWRV